MERGRPLDLHVAHAVGGLVLDQLGGDASQRITVLHQLQRQLERFQQLGLRAGVCGGDERVEHAEEHARRSDAVLRGKFDRRRGSQASVEVQVQLGLRHRLQKATYRTARFAHQ